MRLVPRNPAGEASEGRDQSAGYARRSHFHAIADVGSIPTVSTILTKVEPAQSPRGLGLRRLRAEGVASSDWSRRCWLLGASGGAD